MRYGYGRNQKKGIIGLSNFIGYNSVDDPSNLPLGYLVTGSKNIDISRSRGGLPKVMGRTALFTSLGSGGIKGLHNYRHSSGDIPLFGWGTALYKVSGTEYTITKTTKADFDAGTSSNIYSDNNSLEIPLQSFSDDCNSAPATKSWTDIVSIETDGSCYYKNGSMVKVLDESCGDFTIWYKDHGSAWNDGTGYMYLKLLDASDNVVAYIKEYDPSSGSVSRYIDFYVNGVSVITHTSYYEYIIIERNGSNWYLYESNSSKEKVSLIASKSSVITLIKKLKYERNADTTLVAADDMELKSNVSSSASWVSPVYELTGIPITCIFTMTTTIPDDTSIIVNARGSGDGVLWGDWQVVTSNDALPRKKFLQIKVELEATISSTPVLSDITITYTIAYDTSTSIHTGLSGNKVRFCDYEGTCYIADGGRPHKYDGTTVYDVGIDAPGSAPTVAASATAGNPNGDYYCKVTFINDYGAESNASVASSKVSPASKKIDWSDIPTGAAGSGVTGRKLYRTKAGGASDGDYYFVATIDDNTTTTYTDNTADAALITTLEIDNDIPPNSSIVLEHKNYMMYVDDNLLYFSKVTLPDSVPANNYKQFPDDITGIRTYQNYLAVQGRTFSAVVYGDIWGGGSDDTDIKILNKSVGAVNHEAMAECYGSGIADILVFPTEAGVSYFDLGTQEQSVRTSPISEEVQNIFDGAVNKENMAAIYNNYLYMVALDYYTATDTPTSANNIIMTYDLRRKKWYPPITYGISCFCIADGLLLAGDSANGKIYQMNSGSTDAGSNIHAIAVTSVINPQGNSYKSKFTRLRLKVDDTSVTDSLQIKPSVDGEEGTIDIESTLMWQTETLSPYYRIPLPRGNEIQLTVEDNSTNDWVISSINIEYEGGEL